LGKIKVAIIGVGNCASSLVQGIHKYVEIPPDDEIPGVMHNTIGDYRIEDIQIVAAFDIDENKVGKDLSEAIFTAPNNTLKFSDVPMT
jgi:myo-inositol-1-phosphate synthase